MSDPSSRSSEVKPRLGRGLAALLGEAKPTASGEGSATTAVREAPIEFIRSNPRNPRQNFPDEEMDELTASIRERGILQPIVVRPVSGVQDTYEIVAGERRWRAAQRAGRHTVPIISLMLNDREALEISIIENVQRTDLNALEEANGYAHLASEYGYSHADIGRVVGKSRSHVANTLRLLALPESVRGLLADGSITAGHARALLTVAQAVDVAKRIVEDDLTVRDVEKLSSLSSSEVRIRTVKEVDPHIKDLIQRLSLALGTTTSIVNSKRVKEIRIKFKEFEQLEFICNKLFS
jgi:ParB family chromosome partitioning protein